LDEQRIGMMYLNLFKRWVGGLWDDLFPKGFRRSPALPILVILLVVVCPIVAWKMHRLGRFGRIKRELAGQAEMAPVIGPRPGGLDPIVLTRTQTPGNNMPEFRSATLLPGMGLEVLQITAFVPSRGEIELLAAPTPKDISDGTTPNRSGPNDNWGGVEAPWAGLLTGSLAPLGTSFRMTWRGRTLESPTEIAGRGMSEDGLLSALGADTTDLTPEPSPTTATATFRATDFDQHWPSKNDVTVAVTLGARTIDLDVMVKNIGDQPEPMGIGWHPRFSIPSGNRDAAELRLPNGQLLEIGDAAKGIPTGRMVPAGASISRFQQRPWPIGPESVDGSLAHLKSGVMDTGLSAEVRDPGSEFGLRMTAVSDNIRELRVSSPSGANYVSLGTQTNFDDPLGKEWGGADNLSIPDLLPGQTAEWKVRLEIFSVANHSAATR
jgi:aldose 1-epimerase